MRENQTIETLTFGAAIEAMKKGNRISRRGWNGPNQFVVYQKGYPDGIPCNKQTAEAFGYNEGDLFKCRPYMQLRCSDGTHQMWAPSTSDVLAEDWYIVQNNNKGEYYNEKIIYIPTNER